MTPNAFDLPHLLYKMTCLYIIYDGISFIFVCCTSRNYFNMLIAMKLSGLLLFISCFSLCVASEMLAGTPKFNVSYDTKLNGICIRKGSDVITRDLHAVFRLNGKSFSTKDYSGRTSGSEKITDQFGKGKVFVLKYKEKGLPILTQYFYIYDH